MSIHPPMFASLPSASYAQVEDSMLEAMEVFRAAFQAGIQGDNLASLVARTISDSLKPKEERQSIASATISKIKDGTFIQQSHTTPTKKVNLYIYRSIGIDMDIIYVYFSDKYIYLLLFFF